MTRPVARWLRRHRRPTTRGSLFQLHRCRYRVAVTGSNRTPGWWWHRHASRPAAVQIRHRLQGWRHERVRDVHSRHPEELEYFDFRDVELVNDIPGGWFLNLEPEQVASYCSAIWARR